MRCLVHGSWFTVHGSRFTVHGLRFTIFEKMSSLSKHFSKSHKQASLARSSHLCQLEVAVYQRYCWLEFHFDHHLLCTHSHLPTSAGFGAG